MGRAGTELASARRHLPPPETITPGGERGDRGLFPVPDALTLHLSHAVCSGTWHPLSETVGFKLIGREWQALSLPLKQALGHPRAPCHLVPRAPGVGPWRDAAWAPLFLSRRVLLTGARGPFRSADLGHSCVCRKELCAKRALPRRSRVLHGEMETARRSSQLSVSACPGQAPSATLATCFFVV